MLLSVLAGVLALLSLLFLTLIFSLILSELKKTIFDTLKFTKGWYLNQNANSDVVISASPEFLLQSICNRLGVSLIASKVDPSTGQFTVKNCHGQEKVKRFTELYPNETIDEFYTDSKSDYPFAALAKKVYLVKKRSIKNHSELG